MRKAVSFADVVALGCWAVAIALYAVAVIVAPSGECDNQNYDSFVAASEQASYALTAAALAMLLAASLFLGGALGVAAGAAFTALTYYGLVSIPTRHIFTVTTVLIALLAAGMAAQAVQYLDAGGVINVLSGQLWDSSPWLPQDSIIGRVLHALIGYTDRPTELQLLAYLGTLALMAALAWVATPTRSPRTAV